MEKQTIEPIVMLYDRIAVHLCPLRNGKTVRLFLVIVLLSEVYSIISIKYKYLIVTSY